MFNHSDGVKGNLALGGELPEVPPGQWGDNGIEIDLIKRFETAASSGKCTSIARQVGQRRCGHRPDLRRNDRLRLCPEAKFWAGQRRLRIQDVHIVDNFLMNYGDNQGAGVTDIPWAAPSWAWACSLATSSTTTSHQT